MSEDDNQVPSALVAVGTKALAVRSETLIKRGLALAREPPAGRRSGALNLGIALYKKGDLDGAIAEYRAALRLTRMMHEAHCNSALALDDKGDLDGAIAEYREALRLNPESCSGAPLPRSRA